MNKLTTAVWEITMGCNMRCKHCGSSCAEALPDELNTSEALEVCDQLKDLGLKVITLSGGEPTTRSDWHMGNSIVKLSKITEYKPILSKEILPQDAL